MARKGFSSHAGGGGRRGSHSLSRIGLETGVRSGEKGCDEGKKAVFTWFREAFQEVFHGVSWLFHGFSWLF